jgi:hypothetical protein
MPTPRRAGSCWSRELLIVSISAQRVPFTSPLTDPAGLVGLSVQPASHLLVWLPIDSNDLERHGRIVRWLAERSGTEVSRHRSLGDTCRIGPSRLFSHHHFPQPPGCSEKRTVPSGELGAAALDRAPSSGGSNVARLRPHATTLVLLARRAVIWKAGAGSHHLAVRLLRALTSGRRAVCRSHRKGVTGTEGL